METVTTLLELVGMLLIVAAVAVAIGTLTVLGVPGALGTAGIGLIAVSLIANFLGTVRR